MGFYNRRAMYYDQSASPTPSTEVESESVASLSSSSASSFQEMDQIKQAIRTYLDAAADGSFTTLGSLPDAVNPGLLLKGVGKIGLPLSERDAKAIKLGREAPTGQDTKKNINKLERKTYEIEADRVELRNPRWSKTVQYALQKSVCQLGVMGGVSHVRAEFREMVLYEGDGAPHTEQNNDTVSGRFGTLVVVLPSEHEGGQVAVQLGNRKRTLSIPEPREFSYSYMAWYADVNISVEPICSGSRLALTYDLIHQNGNLKAARPPSILNKNKEFPDGALEAWKARLDDDTATEKLVYLFESYYSQEEFGLQSLEGSDHVQTLHLHEACQEHGFSTFLGQLEHTNRRGGYGEEDEDDEDQEWNITKLYTLEGVCIAEGLDIERDDVIQSQPFEGDSPDEEECDDWCSESGKVTETYKRSCVVVVPSQHLDTVLHKASRLNVSDWLQALLERFRDEGNAEDIRNELSNTCSLSSSSESLSSSDTDTLVSAALQLNAPSIMISALEKSKWGFSRGAIHEFGEALASRDVTPWLPAIATGISSMRRLTLRLNAVKLFQYEYDTALNLRKQPTTPSEKDPKETEDLKGCLVNSLGRGSLDIADGDDRLLIETARSHGESFVFRVMRPISLSVIRNTDFIANICSMLSEETSQPWLSAAAFQKFINAVINNLARAISDHCALRAANESKTALFQPPKNPAYPITIYSISEDIYPTSLSWRALSALLCLCEKLELYGPVPKLLKPIISIARSAGPGDHTDFLIPLLQSLSQDLAVSQHSLKDYQRLFQEALLSLIKEYVGFKPTPSKDWTRAKANDRCSGDLTYRTFDRRLNRGNKEICDDCSELNDFLVAPDRSEWRFKAVGDRRKHIETISYGRDFKTSVDKSEKPFTLIVTKTDESYRNDLKAWEGRCRSLISTFDVIGQEKLKMMLAEKYQTIMELYEDVKTGKDGARARMPLVPVAELKTNRKRERESEEDAPPEKRAKKVEIIDLSEA